MDNRKRKKTNKQNPNKNTNTNTEVLNTEEEKIDHVEAAPKDAEKSTEVKAEKQKKSGKSDTQKAAVQQKKEETSAESKAESDNTKYSGTQKEDKQKENKQEKKQKEDTQKESVKKDEPSGQTGSRDFSSEHMKETAMNAAKILLPVAACAIVIAVIISYIGSRKSQAVDNPSLNMADGTNTAGVVALSDEPLAENAYVSVNELMQSFYTALADGDIDTVKSLKDENTDREIITYEKKSEFIESYDNVTCYTKPGIEENSYFVYVTYDVKFKDVATEAPGLEAFYVYSSEDGSLRIDGDTEENIKAAFKLVTSQDDVVDLYNKINVSYSEATASDEALNQFMEELPATIRTSVGVALAQLESGETPQAETDSAEAGETQSTEMPGESGEPLQNQTVNQIVRTTDTVNVRSSDSEEADKIGKAQAGTELKRIEERINGWSKVIFEDREAYIKSDYLEVVTSEVTTEPTGTVTATTNVNVRSQANQESERLGSAQTGTSYKLLEDQGEWYQIDYNGTVGYVKAEFFTK